MLRLIAPVSIWAKLTAMYRNIASMAREDVRQIWAYRHFCFHLAMSDLRARFRRSYLGILWAMLQPLLMTAALSVVLVLVFEQSFQEYSVYVYTGLISWEFIAAGFNLGALSLVGAEGYLKQARIPLMVFPFKAIIHAAVIFVFAFTGFIFYALIVQPKILILTWLLLPIFWVVAVLLITPLAVISSIMNMRVRDYQQAIGLVLQTVMYVSPVFIARAIFDKGHLATLTYLNPVAAYLDFFRAIVLYGQPPDSHDVILCLMYGALFWIVAIAMVRKNEKKIIYYF